MPEQVDGQDASALDAIEAVAEAGLRRDRSAKWGLLPIALSLLLLTAAAVACYFLIMYVQRPKLAHWPVAILLPEKDGGQVAENATRQWQGFKRAFKDHKVDEKEQHFYHFKYPIEEGGREQIIKQLEDWYEDGIRTFIITMSGAVDDIKKDFISWAERKPDNGRPVLVATVASAPDIAASEDGVFRHYIRSRDESDVLSTYIEMLELEEVFIVYIDDAYGQKARDIFKKRLHIQDIDKLMPVKLADGDSEIRQKVERMLELTEEREDAVIVIVGYGDMIRNALLALQQIGQGDGKFEGDILVVSTFTEEAWRPELENDLVFAERIHTVGPDRVLDPQKDNRGVVFQFSYLTLDKALQCKDSHGLSKFTKCWIDAKAGKLGKEWAEIEVTADGDSHVSLRLLKKKDWYKN